MSRVLRVVDLLGEKSGKSASWLVLILVFTLSYDTLMRYLFRSPTAWSFDIGYMVAGTLMLLGMAYVTTSKRHVRVDVIYALLPERLRRIIDVLFGIFLTLPLLSMLLYRAVSKTWWSYSISEFSSYGLWRPVLWPFKGVIMVGLFLLLAACVAWVIRDLYWLVGRREP